jgi:hypothetical protein
VLIEMLSMMQIVLAIVCSILPVREAAVNGVDSDLLMLYIDQTSLPYVSIGKGVFAKYDIPEDEILCEYRGMVIGHEYRLKQGIMLDKVMRVPGPDGVDLFMVGDGVCATINDSARITVLDEYGNHVVPYSDEELDWFEASTDVNCIPTHPGYSYNAWYDIRKATGKVFVRSLVNISAGSEIFAPYGG